MKDNKVDKVLKDIWSKPHADATPQKTEVSWENFAHKTFKQTRKKKVLWYYSAAAVLLILISVGVLRTHQTISQENLITKHLNVIENPSKTIKEVKLPDNSVVILQPNAKLTFSENFTKNRATTLYGEAFFSIAKNKDYPFSVRYANTTTTVLGTEFSIKRNPGNAIVVELYEGKVQMNIEGNKRNWLLEPGEKFVYNTENPIIKPFELFKNFDNEPLSVVSNFIQKNFNYKVKIPQNLTTEKTTIKIYKKEQLTTITAIIAEIHNLDYKIKPNEKEIVFSLKK
ncbi:ferric-dicitrate binding protein FerR (iron transport regulator) [Mesonia hippocampi]|uniref:Ferric-dicitrate binding protein FerR (Iron transport regulator) n=1 Tax=Mesonia hippocampi TaxID=1628250 RepID=A0A840EXH4_9FLAO|nr:FecR family protein [Mesonia hippocampi]MBB4119537.1 ferric-dicitrate binding protein FerR (iron transport regulator) [Mesonia hippocampi]